jgi:hypothetical protein
MLCETCHTRPALERDGKPVTMNLFGEVEGCFCAECVLAYQQPHEAELRRSIAEHVPQITAEQLEAMPDQMLKFTLCVPVPRSVSGER